MENKTSRYFKYAIGEIILVVIGILIALQINNWNDKQIAINKSKDFLTEMLKDLATDTLYLNKAIKIINEELDAKEWVLNKTIYTIEDFDSIQNSIGSGYWDFYINDRTFQKIQNSSESKLVGYDSLYNSISGYYTEIKKRIEKNTEYEIRESTRRDIKEDNLYKLVEFDIALTRPKGSKMIEKTVPNLQTKRERNRIMFEQMNWIEVRNDIKIKYMRDSFLLTWFIRCKNRADNLILDIEEALNYD